MSNAIPPEMRVNWLREQALPLVPLVTSEVDGDVHLDPLDPVAQRQAERQLGFSWIVADQGHLSSAVHMPGKYHFSFADLVTRYGGAILGRHLSEERQGSLGFAVARFRTTAFLGDEMRSMAAALVSHRPPLPTGDQRPIKRRLCISQAGPESGVFIGTGNGIGFLAVKPGDCVQFSCETFVGLSPHMVGVLLEPTPCRRHKEIDGTPNGMEPVITSMPADLITAALTSGASLNGSSFNWLARAEALERSPGLLLEWLGDDALHIHRLTMDPRTSRRVLIKKRHNVAVISMVRGALDLAIHGRERMRIREGEDYFLPKGVNTFAFTSVPDAMGGRCASGQALIVMPGVLSINSTVSTKVL
jgi:hypothetical protein